MKENPFAILQPYSDDLRVILCTKEDAAEDDAAVQNVLHASKLASLHQEHGNRTVHVEDTVQRDVSADGLCTNTPKLGLVVRWADCQNFILYAPEKKAVGLLHAGWRSLNSGAIPNFCRTFAEAFNVDLQQTVLGAGPSLCTRCAEFSDPPRELSNIDAGYVNGRQVNLQQAATDAFVGCGIRPDCIERSPDCPRCQPGEYWTYRGGHRGDVLAGRGNALGCVLL